MYRSGREAPAAAGRGLTRVKKRSRAKREPGVPEVLGSTFLSSVVRRRLAAQTFLSPGVGRRGA